MQGKSNTTFINFIRTYAVDPFSRSLWFVVAQFCGVLAQMRRALLRFLREYSLNFGMDVNFA